MAQFDLQITIEYDLVSASHKLQLIEEIKKRIAEGWQPLGGAFAHDDDFYQTMVREKKPDPPKLGDRAACQACDAEIVFDGRRWDHIGELKPRHPAWPKE